jgi:hypothetical protein
VQSFSSLKKYPNPSAIISSSGKISTKLTDAVAVRMIGPVKDYREASTMAHVNIEIKAGCSDLLMGKGQ